MLDCYGPGYDEEEMEYVGLYPSASDLDDDVETAEEDDDDDDDSDDEDLDDDEDDEDDEQLVLHGGQTACFVIRRLGVQVSPSAPSS